MDTQPVTIELRQEDNNVISQNGNWDATVQPVTLNDGDSITVDKVFLDTRDTGDGEIVIEEPGITFHYEVAHYVRKMRGEAGNGTNTNKQVNKYGQYGLSGTSPYYWKETTPPATGQPDMTYTPGTNAESVADGMPYVACKTQKEASGPNPDPYYSQLAYVTCERKDLGLGGTWGGVDVTLQYDNGSGDATGSSQTYHLQKFKFNALSRKAQQQTFDLAFPILFRPGTTPKIVHPPLDRNDYSSKYNTKFTLGPSLPVTGSYAFTPYITGKNIIIPAGFYTPAALCKFLNREFQSAVNIMDSPAQIGWAEGQPSNYSIVDSPNFRSSDDIQVFTGLIEELGEEVPASGSTPAYFKKGYGLPFWDAGVGGRCFLQATTQVGLDGLESTTGSPLIPGNAVKPGTIHNALIGTETGGGSSPVITNPVRQIWTGASSLEIDYNTDTNSFFFKYAHTPYFGDVQGVTAESVALQSFPGLAPTAAIPKGTWPPVKGATVGANDGEWKKNQMIQVNSNGGVIFTKMTASINDPGGSVEGSSDFVTSVLGFDGSQVAPLPLQKTVDIAAAGSRGHDIGIVSYPKWDETIVLPGITLTENFNGLSNGIFTAASTGDNSDPFWAVKQPGIQGSSLVSTSTDTVGIVAPNTQDFSALKFGYYLLEIQSGFMNNFVTKLSNDGTVTATDENMRNINSIVGRYYSKNSYTQSDGGLVYQHKGDPITIDSFKIRVLDSSKNIPSLGVDNSIILQVVRAPPVSPPPDEKK